MPNVLHLLHSLFNEYSERQINTDRTAVKGGSRGSVERGELEERKRWSSKRDGGGGGGGAAGLEQDYRRGTESSILLNS